MCNEGKKWEEELHPVIWVHEVKLDHLYELFVTRVRKTKKAHFLKDFLMQIRIDDQYFSSILTKIRNFFDISFELKSNDTKE